MLGITPLVSISDSRLGLMMNSSIPLDSAKDVLEISTSLNVRPRCSRISRSFLPADNTVFASAAPYYSASPVDTRKLSSFTPEDCKCSGKLHSELPYSLTPSLLTWVRKPLCQLGTNKTASAHPLHGPLEPLS